MDKYQNTDDNPKLTQKDINHLNRSVTHNEIEAAIKNLPKKKSPGQTNSLLSSTKSSKEN
jgi:hypothetical protein